jgi:flavorubredoxin
MTTKADEIAPGIYRLSALFPGIGPSGLTFNQFLLDDDEPLLFHTGRHSMSPAVCAAIERVMPVSRLRWITFGHVESDECGATNEFLAPAHPPRSNASPPWHCGLSRSCTARPTPATAPQPCAPLRPATATA